MDLRDGPSWRDKWGLIRHGYWTIGWDRKWRLYRKNFFAYEWWYYDWWNVHIGIGPFWFGIVCKETFL